MPIADEVGALLVAPAPAPELQERFAPYAPLIGTWLLRSVQHLHTGDKTEVGGFVQFAWAMGGQAVLDVWRFDGGVLATTMTYYDPKIERFRATWLCPARNLGLQFISHQIEERLVLSGVNVEPPQRRIRWTYSDIAADRFTWLGEYSDDAGMQWRTTQEMTAVRES